MKDWTLVFFDGSSVETFDVDGDPQQAAIEIMREHPYLQLIAAVADAPLVLVRDSARTAECALEGWPPASLPAPQLPKRQHPR